MTHRVIGRFEGKLEQALRVGLLLFTVGLALSTMSARADGGRLLATGGVIQLEGAAGGGIVPWALIGGYGTKDEIGGTGFASYVDSGHFNLITTGATVGIYDRLELSFTRQRFNLGKTVPGESIDLDVVGAKLKVYGDAVFDQDRWTPQVALGVQYKRNLDFDLVPARLGAEDNDGVDFYLAATKLYLAGAFGRNVLVNATVRATRANQFGLLGFGGDRHDDYQAQFEGSVAVFLTDAVAIGAEFRSRPDNLRSFEENDIFDLFAAWLPTKHVAVTVAYADLGRIANRPDEEALYVSVQLSY